MLISFPVGKVDANMKTPRWLVRAAALILATPVPHVAANAPLKLVQTFKLPADVKGHFDHITVDVKGGRIFTTPEDYKSVIVLDEKSGEIVHTIAGIERPHAVLYREDLGRIYVTDGG